jgi:hypothetical protein
LRLTGIASLCAVVGCTLLCTTQMSRAQTTGQTGDDQKTPAEIGGGWLIDHPGLGRPNPLRLGKPLRDANGNLLHHSGRPVEISVSSVIVYPTSIDVMQMFIPWEFRVTGMFER